MDPRPKCASKSFRLALLISLTLHGVALVVHLAVPEFTPRTPVSPRFDATLKPASRPPLAAPPPPKQAAAKSRNDSRTAVLTAKGKVGPRNWSMAERKDMDSFLKELEAENRPAKGAELARRSLAMARQLGREADPDSGPIHPAQGGKPIESHSLEMYFDAFVRKMNRSAAFVPRVTRSGGSRFAQVLVTLNADGSLQSYKVLRAADQQAEIDYIRSVVERASPFAAFPPDIKSSTNTLTVMMCITPKGEGSGFTRIFGSRECRD